MRKPERKKKGSGKFEEGRKEGERKKDLGSVRRKEGKFGGSNLEEGNRREVKGNKSKN